MYCAEAEVMESPEERIVKWLQETRKVREGGDASPGPAMEEHAKTKKTKSKAAKIHIHIPS